jgi:hypothetical protein
MKKVVKITESQYKKLLTKKSPKKNAKFIKESFTGIKKEGKKIKSNELFEGVSSVSNKLFLSGYSPEQINEGIFDFIGDLVGSAPTSVIQTLKEKAFRWLLSKLGLTGKILDFLVISLGNMDISDYKLFLSPLQNCEKIADYLVDGFLEWLAAEGMKKFDLGSGMFADTIRNAFAEAVNDKGFVQTVQDKMNPIICQKIRQVFSDKEGQSDFMGDIKSAIPGLG